MNTTAMFRLFKRDMGAPVLLNSAETGVLALVNGLPDKPWCLIADQRENKGASATNAYSEFANAIVKATGLRIDQTVWFELDSMGHFNHVFFKNCLAGFMPLIEYGCNTNSRAAFIARLDRFDLPHTGADFQNLLEAATGWARPQRAVL